MERKIRAGCKHNEFLNEKETKNSQVVQKIHLHLPGHTAQTDQHAMQLRQFYSIATEWRLPSRCIPSPDQTRNSSLISCLKSHKAPPASNVTLPLTCKQTSLKCIIKETLQFILVCFLLWKWTVSSLLSCFFPIASSNTYTCRLNLKPIYKRYEKYSYLFYFFLPLKTDPLVCKCCGCLLKCSDST